MKQLTICEARQTLSHLEPLLAAEGEVTITRRGKAIALVVPITRKLSYLPIRTSAVEYPACGKETKYGFVRIGITPNGENNSIISRSPSRQIERDVYVFLLDSLEYHFL